MGFFKILFAVSSIKCSKIISVKQKSSTEILGEFWIYPTLGIPYRGFRDSKTSKGPKIERQKIENGSLLLFTIRPFIDLKIPCKVLSHIFLGNSLKSDPLHFLQTLMTTNDFSCKILWILQNSNLHSRFLYSFLWSNLIHVISSFFTKFSTLYVQVDQPPLVDNYLSS